ncbi:glycosyltransferase [Tropicimonas sp. IMCC34043]|uniref:glycosyltransferase family 2 protein n=1 Tax=Tropicimonas sp. IMCC34043 TaxID=2248760 RepID=UPI000E23BDE6|nr:glycosyltransferase [Tropicimonas sp. IMCC34043]
MTPAPTAPRVSCIVPAFNEGPRIGAVLATVTGHPLIDQVIVIDDGSTDDTAAIVEAHEGATLIRMGANGGKTLALAAGIAAADGPLLLLVDADLCGLQAQDLTALLTPVLRGDAGMAISLRRNAPRLWHWIGLDYISGERVLARSLIEGDLTALPDLPRFGFEVWLNGIVVRRQTRLAVVAWPGVDSPAKARKAGLVRGSLMDLGMVLDLVKAAGPMSLLSQILRMRRQRVPSP